MTAAGKGAGGWLCLLGIKMGHNDHMFKVLIIGDATVGKTSLVQRYANDSFNKHYKSTVGVDFALKVVQWSESETVRLQLWDIAAWLGSGPGVPAP
uniref:Uncharacterized protein n=1 Tax=Terrapene triunguis TaxID=2587831 RepID=A0A674IIT9_9SAUR